MNPAAAIIVNGSFYQVFYPLTASALVSSHNGEPAQLKILQHNWYFIASTLLESEAQVLMVRKVLTDAQYVHVRKCFREKEHLPYYFHCAETLNQLKTFEEYKLRKRAGLSTHIIHWLLCPCFGKKVHISGTGWNFKGLIIFLSSFSFNTQ